MSVPFLPCTMQLDQKASEKSVVISVFVGNIPINGALDAIAIYVRATATGVFTGKVDML
jgi:hypothetical protein